MSLSAHSEQRCTQALGATAQCKLHCATSAEGCSQRVRLRAPHLPLKFPRGGGWPLARRRAAGMPHLKRRSAASDGQGWDAGGAPGGRPGSGPRLDSLQVDVMVEQAPSLQLPKGSEQSQAWQRGRRARSRRRPVSRRSLHEGRKVSLEAGAGRLGERQGPRHCEHGGSELRI